VKTVIPFVVAIAVGSMANMAAQQPPPTPSIGFVSMSRISAQSTEAKAAAAEIEQLRKQKANEIAAKQRAVSDAQLQVANAGGYFQGSKRARLQAEETKLREELQHLTQQAQADLQNREREIQATLSQRIGAILNDLARQRGLQIVLNSDTSVVWALAGEDLTIEVINRMNSTAPAPSK
jgi:Skp family chaperone for outer membrane proteins